MKIATTQFDLLFCVAFDRLRMCCLASEAHGVERNAGKDMEKQPLLLEI